MKVDKLKGLADFKNQEFKGASIYGGWKGIFATGSGEIGGMRYTQDIHVDDNDNGIWDVGESVIFHYEATIHQG